MNTGRVKRMFDIMARFAPTLASEPTVAACWVRALAYENRVAPSHIHDLCRAELAARSVVGAEG